MTECEFKKGLPLSPGEIHEWEMVREITGSTLPVPTETDCVCTHENAPYVMFRGKKDPFLCEVCVREHICSKTYHILEGVRMVAFAASCQQNWPVTWAHVFVDCQKCNQSIGMRFDDDGSLGDLVANETAAMIFRLRGWKVVLKGEGRIHNEILCPECSKKEEKE